MTSLKQIMNSYHERGFKIRHILADSEFEITRKHIECINTMGCNEHVPEIKC